MVLRSALSRAPRARALSSLAAPKPSAPALGARGSEERWSEQRLAHFREEPARGGYAGDVDGLQRYARRAYRATSQVAWERADYGTMLCEKLAALGPGFVELVVDPGLMAHVDGFIAFAHAQPAEQQRDPWALRDAFAKSLGRKAVYRGLALDDDSAARIAEEGLVASGLRFGGDKSYLGCGSVQGGLSSTLRQATHGFMPVSKLKHLSAGVPALSRKSRGVDGIFVYTLDVPKLDVLMPFDGPFSRNGSVLSFPGAPFYHPLVEQFLPVCAERGEIVDVQKMSRRKGCLLGASALLQWGAVKALVPKELVLPAGPMNPIPLETEGG